MYIMLTYARNDYKLVYNTAYSKVEQLKIEMYVKYN